MSYFENAVEVIFEHEGGLVDNPKDPGGLTNFGISQRAYPSVDIRGLTKVTAAAIYKRDYWDKINGDLLKPAIALCVFDSAVNQGVGFAAKALQKECGVTADGAIGPATAAAANKNTMQTVERFMTARILHYGSLPTFDTFGKGWIKRILRVHKVAVGLV
jgi:lysozyme family protein